MWSVSNKPVMMNDDMLSVIMLSVVTLNVVILSVAVPQFLHDYYWYKLAQTQLFLEQ
jgi:hypothetical protein